MGSSAGAAGPVPTHQGQQRWPVQGHFNSGRGDAGGIQVGRGDLSVRESAVKAQETDLTDDNNTTIDAIQIDEDVLSHTVSDEALEAAAGTEGGIKYCRSYALLYSLCSVGRL